MSKDASVFLEHIHRYFGVDLELTWRLVRQELPPFERQVREILEHSTESPDPQD